MPAARSSRMPIRVLSMLLAACCSFPAPLLASAKELSAAGPERASSITFDCTGQTSDGRGSPPFASGGEVKFTVSATFGEGATVALVDPETSALLRPLYDAETTVGRLRFGDGEETTVVWTRMSGVDGALMGAAIMSDGDVLALTIEQRPQGKARPFVLFAASSASLARGTCAVVGRR